MKTLEYDQYTLVKAHVPEIINNQIKNGLLYGGIKLIYTKRKVIFKEIYIGKFRILIPIKRFKSKEVTFLRPFKKFWNVKDNRLTPNKWGKKKHPLTLIWCELTNGTYSNIMIASSISQLVRRVFEVPKDKVFIKHLNNQSKRFKILSTNN